MNQLQIQYAKKKENDKFLRIFFYLTSLILERANSANSLLISIARGDRIAIVLCGSF